MKILYFPIFIIIAILLLSFSSLKYETKESNEILWESQRKLVWEDFTGTVDTSSNAVALTSWSIRITDANFEKNLPKYKLASYFIKNESWTNTIDKIALEHEQLHFDIAEIYTRKIRKAFDSLNLKKCSTNSTYNEMYSKLENACSDYQHKFDGEVYFDSVQHKKWKKKVSIELERLKKYAAK